MPNFEIYAQLDRVPGSIDVVISPGRQLSLGHPLADALRQPYDLSVMSTLNVIAGAMISKAAGSALIVTGNERAAYPRGAEKLLDERYPDIQPLLETESPTTLASGGNVASLLQEVIRAKGAVEVVIASDRPQGLRLATMLEDREVPVRGVAVAHRIVADAQLPEDRALVRAHEEDRWSRHLEAAKQIGLRLVDPHGTRIGDMARRVRP